MSKKLETTFKERILPKIRALPNTWVYKTQQVAVRGIPDLIACVNGIFVAIELKAGKSASITKLQEYCLEKIKEAKGISLVCYPENWLDIYSLLKKISKGESYVRPETKPLEELQFSSGLPKACKPSIRQCENFVQRDKDRKIIRSIG